MKENLGELLGIVDNDFNLILNEELIIDNILFSDFHDIEISIIESPAFDCIVETHCDKEKVKKLEIELKKKLKDILYELALEIGYLKLANKLFDLGLSFKPETPDGKPLSYSDFVDY